MLNYYPHTPVTEIPPDGMPRRKGIDSVPGRIWSLLYLMGDGGRHAGWIVTCESVEGGIMRALEAKIFSYLTTNINPPGELQMNAWLAEHPDIEIVHVLQSESMVAVENRIERNLTITLLYRPSAD